MSKYVPYHAESQGMAKQLCSGIRDPVKKLEIITGYVSGSIGYDYIRATKVAKLKGQYPDVSGCWSKHMGICLDTAALTVGMLRAVGIRAYLCIGHADRNYHAWVEAIINGQTFRYDHDGKANNYNVERKY